jgi:hypothetical protein
MEDRPNYSNFDLNAAIETEMAAATADSPKPQFSFDRLDRLFKLLTELIQKTASACISADEVRFVATIFKGAVDLWHPKGR